MIQSAVPEDPPSSDDHQQAASLFGAIFDPDDIVAVRPIETWVEGDRKRNLVVWKAMRWFPAKAVINSDSALFSLIQRDLQAHRANGFFGVCPRVGPAGKYDLAWQIRVVRTLWADIDNCPPDEAVDRCRKAGLPSPSLVVASGGGSHVYWTLTEPYFIDDVPAPPPVEKEWVEIEGRKKALHYFVDAESANRVYLDDPATGRALAGRAPALSPKAQRVQDVLAGIAAKIGGDHTQDLSRLLRIPGTKNRKNERNGREPRPCLIAECWDDRYPFSSFEEFAQDSPDVARRKKIESYPLPAPKPLRGGKKVDRLNELVWACQNAEVGTRSEADFALCCYAIEQAVPKDHVKGLVANIGKFAERADYFDRTWGKAEQHTREKLFEQREEGGGARRSKKGRGDPRRNGHHLNGHGPANATILAAAAATDPAGGGGDSSGAEDPGDPLPDDGLVDYGTIVLDPKEPVGELMSRITNSMLRAGDFYCRSEQVVTINSVGRVVPIDAPEKLAGALSSVVEFAVEGEQPVWGDDDQGGLQYTPLPRRYGETWLHSRIQTPRLPLIKLYSKNPVYTDDWRLVLPGYDAASGIYYAGPEIVPAEGTEHLDALLAEFCFKSPADRTNYLAILLTAVIVLRFIGSKPGILFNGNQPELGKTILAQIIAILRDGQQVPTCSFTPNDEEFEKRLGSRVRSGDTTLVIDNAKGKGGRSAVIDSGCLERCLTDKILSFRLLGYSMDIKAENSHIVAITANAAEASRDLVTRCVSSNLYYEGDPKKRKFRMADPEGYALAHRTEILAELLGMVERWKASGMPRSDVETRFNKQGWGQIVGGILEANNEPDFLGNAEQSEVDLDPTRRDFEELVRLAVSDPNPDREWKPGELAALAFNNRLLLTEMGDGSDRSKSTRMGYILSRYIGQTFHSEGLGTARLRVRDQGHAKLYAFEWVMQAT